VWWQGCRIQHAVKKTERIVLISEHERVLRSRDSSQQLDVWCHHSSLANTRWGLLHPWWSAAKGLSLRQRFSCQHGLPQIQNGNPNRYHTILFIVEFIQMYYFAVSAWCRCCRWQLLKLWSKRLPLPKGGAFLPSFNVTSIQSRHVVSTKVKIA